MDVVWPGKRTGVRLMRLAAHYSYDEFRQLHPDGRGPSDNTIRRWIRMGKLTRSGGGVIHHDDCLDHFNVTEAQFAKMLKAAPDPIGVS